MIFIGSNWFKLGFRMPSDTMNHNSINLTPSKIGDGSHRINSVKELFKTISS